MKNIQMHWLGEKKCSEMATELIKEQEVVPKFIVSIKALGLDIVNCKLKKQNKQNVSR